MKQRPYTTHQFAHHMVDVIAVLKAGMGSTQPMANRTGRRSYADTLREEMDPNQDMEGQDAAGLMALNAQNPKEAYTQRIHENRLRQQALKDNPPGMDAEKLKVMLQQSIHNPGLEIKGEPMHIAWQLLKEQVKDFSSLPPAIQSMMMGDAAKRERGFQTEMRDKQRPLQQGRKAKFTEEMGTPTGVDLPPDQRTMMMAPDAPSSVPAGGRPDLMGRSDMPSLGNEEFFQEQYVPHADTALEAHEFHPPPEVGAGGAIDEESMGGPTRLNDRTNRHLQDVTMEQLMGDEKMSAQIDSAAAGLERYDKMIAALKDGPGKDKMKENRKFYQEKVVGPLMAMLGKRRSRLERKQPHVGTPQRYEYGVERMTDEDYVDGE